MKYNGDIISPEGKKFPSNYLKQVIICPKIILNIYL